jgi:hypothetical protein
VRDAVAVSPHYRRRALCESCHNADRKSLRTADAVALCNRCHGTGEIVGDIHPLRKVPADFKPPASWPLQDGSLTCLTCHSAGHKQNLGEASFLRAGNFTDRNDFCKNCHTKETLKGRNPHLDVNEGKGCELCHVGRPIPGKDTVETVKFIADPNLLCLRCHPETAHPANIDHTRVVSPERAAAIPRELPVYRGGKIVCATCHNPHIKGMEDHKLRYKPGSMGFCEACHGY